MGHERTIRSILDSIKNNTIKQAHGNRHDVLVIPDPHDNPDDPKDRFRWIGEYATDIQPDAVICLGDIADFDSLCSHVRNDTHEGKSKPAFRRDIESLAEALMIFRDAYKPDNPVLQHITIGNHENRIWLYENANPETYGTMSAEFTGLLEHYGWSHTPYGEYFNAFGVDFTHRPLNGMRKPFGGANVAANVARDCLRDTVFGDTHKMAFCTKAKLGHNRRINVLEAGCAMPWGKVKQYARNAVTGWWWGVHLITVVDGSIQGVLAKPMFELEEEYS